MEETKEVLIGEHIKSLAGIEEKQLTDYQIINILRCEDPEKLPFLVAILEKMMNEDLDEEYYKELEEIEKKIKVSDPKQKNIMLALEKFGLLYKKRRAKMPKNIISTLGIERE